MTSNGKVNFSIFKDEDGKSYVENDEKENRKEVKLAVLKPSNKVTRKAQQYYNRAFRDCVTGGTLLRIQIDNVLKDRNLVNDDIDNKIKEVNGQLVAYELRLAKGGISKEKAYKIAIAMIKKRAELQKLNRERDILEQQTAEGQAENERFSYLISECTLYDETSEKYFKDYDDYLDRENKEIVPFLAGQKLMELQFDYNELRKQLPEWKFLLKYKYCDDKLRLKNDDGHFVNEDGELVNDRGQRVDKDDDLIDEDGRKLNKDGTFKVEFAEFYD